MNKQRISSHEIEDRAKDKVRTLINQGGDALFRDITGRNYGIDCMVELFEKGSVTGKIALLQIKGKSEKIAPLKKFPQEISCSISSSNYKYAFQSNIPVVVICTSIQDKEKFYYCILQNINESEKDKQRINIENGKKV